MYSCIPCARLSGLPQDLKYCVDDYVSGHIIAVTPEDKGLYLVTHRPLRIFIVDDDDDLRVSLTAVMESAGIHSEQIIQAHTGHTALEILQYNDVDLLFIDMRFPDGLSGIDILKYAKLKNPYSACYIITGQATIGELDEAAALGAIEVIRKPFNPAHIIEIIEERR